MGNICGNIEKQSRTEKRRKESKEIQVCCIGGKVLGNEKVPFWENRTLRKALKNEGNEMMFFRTLALCNMCLIDINHLGEVKVVLGCEAEDLFVRCARRVGIVLSKYDERKDLKEITIKEQEGKKECWIEFRTMKTTSSGRFGRTVVMRKMVDKEDKGDFHVFSCGRLEKVLGIKQEDENDDTVKDYVAYKKITEVEWGEIKEKYHEADNVVGILRKQEVEKVNQMVEENLIELGYVVF